MRLPAVEVRPMLRRAQLARIDRTERQVVAARSSFADAQGYREILRSLTRARLHFEPPAVALEDRAQGELKEAIEDVMARARENVARLKGTSP